MTNSPPDLRELEETEVLTISLDQAHRYFEMVVRSAGGSRYALSAWNKGGDRLDVEFGAVHMRAGLSNDDNVGMLGELEHIGSAEGTLVLEGDFGDIRITADTVSVRKLD